MSSDAASLAAFRQLLETTASQPGTPSAVLLTDGLVGPAAGALLRRCAIPHEFDRALLRHLGDLSEAHADEWYAQFAELSLMQVTDTTLGMHERWRQPLWHWWLDVARRSEFTALNETLVEWFAAPATQTGEDPGARRRMFHLIGCRQDEGLQLFEAQFRTARWRRRFSECTLLLRLAHEYDPVLHPRARARLRYDEGKLASDLREWERALPLLREVAADADADSQLRISAEVRVGHALRMTGRAPEALTLLEKTRDRAAAESAAARSRWRVLHELGEAYRDVGRVNDASKTLSAALAGANDDDDENADLAGVLNSLGTVQLKLLETDKAISSFQASLEHLKRIGDAVRAGSVLNNLGLAQLERCDWKAAEETLKESLQSKQAAGDVLGQATTLLNLSKAQAAQEHLEDACVSAEKAAMSYETAGDARGRARAQLAQAKLLRRRKQLKESAALLQTVIADAQAAGDADSATEASAELALGARKHGMPWWGWLLVLAVVGGLILLVILFN
jgi:tetratricopeptide (TPR) repeat protein